MMEEKRQNETSENRKYYQGLPITSMSVALPAAVRLCAALPRILSDLAASAGAGGRRSVYHGFPLPQADE